MSTVLNLPEIHIPTAAMPVSLIEARHGSLAATSGHPIYVQGKRVVHLWTHGVFTKCGRPVPPIGKGWTSTKLPPNVDVCRRCQRAP